MRSARGTDGSLGSSLPWTLASLGVAIAPHVPYLPPWITLAFAGCGAWRYLIERRRGALPPAWLRALLALIGFLGVLAVYETISGVGPGSALLTIMASLKLLETRKRRDQFVLLFIAIFLVMSALLREQYLWSLPYLCLAVVFIMTAWLRMSADAAESVRRSFATSGRLILYAAPLALAMWVLFPRIASPFWAVPIDTSSAVSGLSNKMSPGDISSLSLSGEVAFRVRFDGAVPAPRDRYWRAIVLYRFNGRTWSGSDPITDPRAGERIETLGAPIRYELTMEPTRQQYVPALEMTVDWTLGNATATRTHELANRYPIDQRLAFEAEAYTDYRLDRNLNRYIRSWYLSLPDESNPRSRALAREMYAQAGGDAAFIDAVLRKFNEEDYYYTLEPPPLGSDPVDRFLFSTRQGFCEHYASAFATMMRAADIPARVVLGYHGGEFNDLGDYLIVRQSDAHAWTEVWLEGRGWVRVDPTAAVAPQRIEMSVADSVRDGIGLQWGLSTRSEWLHRMQLSWDAVNAKWNEWILGYGPETQANFLETLGLDDPGWRNMLLTLVVIVVFVGALLSLLLTLRNRPPPSDRASVLYRRFARRAGVTPRTGEAPAAFAERLRAQSTIDYERIRAVTASYLEARYGANPEAALSRLESVVAAMPARGTSAGRGRPPATAG